jgi:hypothetical protein
LEGISSSSNSLIEEEKTISLEHLEAMGSMKTELLTFFLKKNTNTSSSLEKMN